MRLYGFPGTRTFRIRWMLEELGAPYEYEHVEVTKGAHKQPAHLELHPHGRVPVFEDGDLRFIESCAAVLHLADKYPEQKLAPAVGSRERGLYYQYIVYAASTLDDAAVQTYFHKVLLPVERRSNDVVEKHAPTLATAISVLERALQGSSYLCGDAFTAADVAVGYALNLADQAGALDTSDNSKAYMARLRARPAYGRVYG